ncbi:peroxisomal membrane protein 11C [Macrosteles quadrilineatus]|uniref:peroxisomal membrane protein 11C n=1 Tax=Macrosteles quadrilineatus TaxID=74068 RepID=UPI0023E19151|nr:peroxisomal membrane protein 11C [Macrosteles quadrilineatus]
MLKGINNQLESYDGRDKILRLIGYTSYLVSGLTKNRALSRFGDSVSECRTILRLLDDLPMLTHTLAYGLGRKEPDMHMQVCGVVVNILDQLYYPLEHVAWAADRGLISLRSDHWWTASNACWAFSLYFSIARSLRYLSLLHNHSKHFDLSDANMREEFKKNQRLQLRELMSGVRSACDLAMAIHWMPDGFLWAGTLKEWHIGALGTLSTVLSLVQSCKSLQEL